MLSTFSLLASVCAALFILDRAWKCAAIWHFFQRSPPPAPECWPALSLVQPITTSPNNLRAVLALRAQNPYPGPLEQIVVLDEQDAASLALCRALMAEYPAWQPRLVCVPSAAGIAMKPVKLLAGLAQATGEVLCFVDDDILLRSDTLATLVRGLQPGVGATFGLACYANWQNAPSSLMSAFVNANALLNYIPLTYLIDPYTITGHIYAMRRADFDAIGGLRGMESRLDDDHELARRVMRAGLCNRQTPARYDVDNLLPTLGSYQDQLKRWFIFPREMMLPGLPRGLQALTFALSLPNLLPGLALLLALSSAAGWSAVLACLAVFYLAYAWGERRYLKSRAPWWAWAALLEVALLLPLQVVFLLFSSRTIRWRGQAITVKPNGEYELHR